MRDQSTGEACERSPERVFDEARGKSDGFHIDEHCGYWIAELQQDGIKSKEIIDAKCGPLTGTLAFETFNHLNNKIRAKT